MEAWFNVHDLEPIRSVFNIPTVMELDSKAAQDAKRNWREQQEYSRPEKPEPLTPSPKERIASLLDRCETKDFRFFHHLCMEMTLQDDSTHYGVERVLFETPGWNHADSRTRTRIVAAAKQFLERDHESIEWAKTAEFNSIHRGGMAAYWLIDHVDRQPVAPSIWNRVGYSVAGAAIATLPSAVLVILFSGDDLGSGWLVAMVLVAAGAFAALYRFLNHTARGKSWLAARIARSFPTWIASRSKEWWNRWAWYIMRELHPNLMGEAEEPKLLAMRTLMAQAPEKVRNQMLRLAGDAEAIEQYSASLRNVSPSPLEDLWNTPSDAKPSPKLEERASDKLCEAIREYFKARAVTAGRELQIRRRLVEKDAGGEAGSRVDVFVTVPAIGTVTGEPIEVPVEVKRSSNKDVKTSLKSQLVDRYMSEVNADVGVYAVMWFDAPNMADGFAPKWPDIETARQELMAQAEAERRAELTVRAIVVDCSLA